MAGRTNYTYTAIYNRSFAKPGRFSAADALTKAYAMEPLDRDDEDSSRGDTPVLALLFFVLPILGLFAILIQPMRWVFTVAAALSLLTMWGLRCFMPRARLVTSVVLTVAMGLALYGALAAPSTALPTGNIGNNLGGDNIISSEALNAALSGGAETDGQAVDDDGALAVQANQSQAQPLSPAETVLNAYLELWKQGNNTEEMVKLCWPEWRRSVDDPQMMLISLFTSYSNKKLLDWEYTMPTVGDDTVISVPLITQQQIQNGSAKYKYIAMLYRVDDVWYVDPSSLKSGVQEIEATPTPDPNATAKPTVTPSISPSLTLWYNSDGGEYFHAKKDCSTIAARFISKMSSFTYSQITDKRYSKLKPCSVCGAPARP